MDVLSNREVFTRILAALGTKDYDTFEQLLDPDILCEWPYAVMEGFPTSVVGSRQLREMLEVSFRQFAPYDFRIIEIYPLAHPDRLIAEYSSHSTYLPRNVPYSNRYVGIMNFHNGRITRWREYLNPMAIINAIGPGFTWQRTQGAIKKPAT